MGKWRKVRKKLVYALRITHWLKKHNQSNVKVNVKVIKYDMSELQFWNIRFSHVLEQYKDGYMKLGKDIIPVLPLRTIHQLTKAVLKKELICM